MANFTIPHMRSFSLRQYGLTMLELIIALALVLLLLSFFALAYNPDAYKARQLLSTMETIKAGVLRYNMDFPGSTLDLNQLVMPGNSEEKSWKGPYLEQTLHLNGVAAEVSNIFPASYLELMVHVDGAGARHQLVVLKGEAETHLRSALLHLCGASCTPVEENLSVLGLRIQSMGMADPGTPVGFETSPFGTPTSPTSPGTSPWVPPTYTVPATPGTPGNPGLPPSFCPSGIMRPASGLCPGETVAYCPDGSVRPSTGVCSGGTPSPSYCPDGSVRPPSGVCPASTCPDGSVRPPSGVCPASTCPDGSVRPPSGVCPASTCPDGSAMPSGGVCPVLIPDDGVDCPPGRYSNALGFQTSQYYPSLGHTVASCNLVAAGSGPGVTIGYCKPKTSYLTSWEAWRYVHQIAGSGYDDTTHAPQWTISRHYRNPALGIDANDPRLGLSSWFLYELAPQGVPDSTKPLSLSDALARAASNPDLDWTNINSPYHGWYPTPGSLSYPNLSVPRVDPSQDGAAVLSKYLTCQTQRDVFTAVSAMCDIPDSTLEERYYPDKDLCLMHAYLQ